MQCVTGSEDAGVHGDVDGDEKERDDILREQVKPLSEGASCIFFFCLPSKHVYWIIMISSSMKLE